MKNLRRLSIISRFLVLIMLFESFAPALPVLPGPDDAYADQWVCGQDLNGDGIINGAGETANCISTQQGELCPISNTTCNCTQTANCSQISLSGGWGPTKDTAMSIKISGSGDTLTFAWINAYGSADYTESITASGATFSGGGSLTTFVVHCYDWGWWCYSYGAGNIAISTSGNILTFTSSNPWYGVMGSVSVTSSATLSGGGNVDPESGFYFSASTSGNVMTFSGYYGSASVTVGNTACPLTGGSACTGSPPTCTAEVACGTAGSTNPTCPLGSQYACMDNNGTEECSPNTCVDLTTNPPATTQINDTMYQNDGATDSNGNCLGQIYIFTGRGSSCQEAGAADSWKDCCADSSQVFSDSAGAAVDVETAASAVETMYHLAQVAYYTNAILASGGTATVSGLSTATLGVQQAVTSGVAAGSAGAGMEAYAAALLNPTTIAITAAIFLAQEFLMQSCTQKDIETASLVSSGYCHYIGEFCSDKWPIIGCVNESKGYCCFNSKLARIIQEQGRPQLKDFGPSGDWGSPDNPNCRGFTPQEFQMLDFSKIDLTSYYGDIEKNMNQNLSNMQTQMKQNVTNFYNNTQK